MIVVIVFFVGGAVVLGSRFVSPSSGTVIEVRMPKLSALAADGKIVFDENCASCHGESGAGSKQGPPLVHNIYNPGHHADEAFFRAARNGVPRHHWQFGNMPPQPDVTRENLAKIIRYVRELQRANGIFYQRHVM
ncbi:MAG: cytochrome c [Rhodospirillaceae bacterium]|nr:cytochrome c [Rhodospirillaceae bacterium]MBT5456944.1 cytochrome c [Rhodospirillaceae bacterium]